MKMLSSNFKFLGLMISNLEIIFFQLNKNLAKSYCLANVGTKALGNFFLIFKFFLCPYFSLLFYNKNPLFTNHYKMTKLNNKCQKK